MIRVTLKPSHGNAPVEVTLMRDEAAGDGVYECQCGNARHELRIDSTATGAGCLFLHGQVKPFYATKQNDELAVWIDGRIYKLEIVGQTARRDSDVAQLESGNDIKAAMPGTILKINVEPGDAIEAQQPIIIMESMKMEMSLSSPKKATIASITCQVGDMVGMGDILATLAPQDDSHEPTE